MGMELRVIRCDRHGDVRVAMSLKTLGLLRGEPHTDFL